MKHRAAPPRPATRSRFLIHRTPSGSQPVDRLVEQQHAGVAEQCRRDAEPLRHAEREPPARRPATLAQADLGPAPRRPAAGVSRCFRRQRRQVRPGRSGRGGTPWRRAPLPPRAAASAATRTAGRSIIARPASGHVLAHDHAHRRRLPRAVRPEEPGHHPRPDREAQPVHRQRGPVALGEAAHLDHARALPPLRCCQSIAPGPDATDRHPAEASPGGANPAGGVVLGYDTAGGMPPPVLLDLRCDRKKEVADLAEQCTRAGRPLARPARQPANGRRTIGRSRARKA